MINDFYSNTRSDIKETEAKIFNLDTNMQGLDQDNFTQLKVY